MSKSISNTRYSDQELKEFEALIIRKIKEAEESYEQLKDSLESSYENSAGRSVNLDEFTDYAEKEYLMAMMSRQRKHIYNLGKAIDRIRNKSYGVCQTTGQLIDKRRLMLVPHTTHSVEGKSASQR